MRSDKAGSQTSQNQNKIHDDKYNKVKVAKLKLQLAFVLHFMLDFCELNNLHLDTTSEDAT